MGGSPIPGEGRPPNFGPHGTAVASVLLGAGVADGGRGMAPGASLELAVALDGGFVALRTLRAFDWLLATSARVILLPFGFSPRTPLFAPLLQHAAKRDVLVVAPIGNVGPGDVTSPGDSPLVLSVGVCDATGTSLPCSGAMLDCSGNPIRPDIVAPGQIRYRYQGQIHQLHGTSMAAAYVAGLAALLLEAHPEALARQIRDALLQGARRPHTDFPGSKYGVADLPGALLAFESSAPPAGFIDSFDKSQHRYIDPRTEVAAAWARGPVPLLIRARDVDIRPVGSIEDSLRFLLNRAGIIPTHLSAADSVGTVYGHFRSDDVCSLVGLEELTLVQCVDVSAFGPPNRYR